jgi:hypothetical protein
MGAGATIRCYKKLSFVTIRSTLIFNENPLSRIFVGLSLIVVLLAGCASQRTGSVRGSEINLRYAEIVAVERVKLPSAAPAGAMVGGFTGLALSQRNSPGRQLAGGVGGALLGGLAVRALEGDNLGYAYQLKFLNGGESKFITEKGYLLVGDCVVVESGVSQNMRRVASTVCAASSNLREPIDLHQNGAAECQEAKRELLLAQGQDAVNNAATKVEILCHF